MSDHAISVIVPAYNAEAYLAAALESIQSQTLPPSQIVVVDDGSTDATADIARQFSPGVTLLSQDNQGPGAARNLGVAHAIGEYVAFLDADDLWEPDKLACQWEALQAHPEAEMVFGHVAQFISPELSEAAQATLACPDRPIAGYVPGTLFIRRETFARVGPFATQWKVGEFIDWYARAVEQGIAGVMLPGVVLQRRVHGANQTIKERDAQRDYVRILKASLDRRRKAGAP